MEQIDIILIERYFEGDLNEQERADFAHRLKTDERFAEAFRLEKDLMAGIETAGNQRLKERLEAIHKEEIKQGATVRTMKPNRRWWLLAAAVVAGLMAGLWWLGLQPAEQKLADQYLGQPFQVEDSFLRGETDGSPARAKALELYRNGDYDASTAAIGDLQAEGNAKAGDFFLAGLCQLYKNPPAYTAALGYFSQASSLDPTAYSDEINWYKGLVFIQLKDKSAANEALDKVANSKSSRNAPQAKELMELLGK